MERHFWTSKRLLSRHINDLRFILLFSLVFVLICVIVIVSQVGYKDFLSKLLTLHLDYGLAGLLAAFSAVAVWCYQSASARLGAVDLFACEIATICRVITVSQTPSHLVRLYDNPPPSKITLNAPYEHSPIFDSNSQYLAYLNSQTIGAITEFYTYLKAMSDYRRMLDEIECPDKSDLCLILIRNLMYMLFLILESGRNLISALVENKAVCAQLSVEILLSELVSYGMLLRTYEEAAKNGRDYDARWKRLKLRARDYQIMIPQLSRQIEINNSVRGDSAWAKADAALIPELERVWCEARPRTALAESGDSQ